MPGRAISPAAGEYWPLLVEVVEQDGGRQESHPSGGELDRQRQPVETLTDRGDGAGIAL